MRELLIDDDDERRDRTVAIVEEAAANQLRAHGFEISWRDVDRVRRDERLARLPPVALGQDDALAVVAAEWNRGAGAGDAGQRAQAAQRLVREGNQRRISRSSRARRSSRRCRPPRPDTGCPSARCHLRSEEHTSELQSPYDLVC